jgi:hypothetical protein
VKILGTHGKNSTSTPLADHNKKILGTRGKKSTSTPLADHDKKRTSGPTRSVIVTQK